MKVDLIIKEIEDKFTRENFSRLSRFIEGQDILGGYFKFYQADFDSAGTNVPLKHLLPFVPQDIIHLSVEGDHNFYYNYENFDADNIYVTVQGPCRIRFLAGSYVDRSYARSRKDYPFVAPTSGGGGIPPYADEAGYALTAGTADFAEQAAKLTEQFDTDALTLPGHLVRVIGTNTVEKITDNTALTIPNGIFGVVLSKPSATRAVVSFIGIMGGYSGFTPGLPLFVSTSGVPTHGPPPSAGMVQEIGFAISTTQFFLQKGAAYRRS